MACSTDSSLGATDFIYILGTVGSDLGALLKYMMWCFHNNTVLTNRLFLSMSTLALKHDGRISRVGMSYTQRRFLWAEKLEYSVPKLHCMRDFISEMWSRVKEWTVTVTVKINFRSYESLKLNWGVLNCWCPRNTDLKYLSKKINIIVFLIFSFAFLIQ